MTVRVIETFVDESTGEWYYSGDDYEGDNAAELAKKGLVQTEDQAQEYDLNWEKDADMEIPEGTPDEISDELLDEIEEADFLAQVEAEQLEHENDELDDEELEFDDIYESEDEAYEDVELDGEGLEALSEGNE